ncbi:MAG TPA: bifunctional 5,10-methylenetetrahydrofolate dehydrogenase/5,10-methenyltetrahydrofolate cyclohydrolase [Candidatus Saccharimonadales bacterium]|jgi:methylenetetrahydrofolate dehydrogenase (NADP+)/methenyltetrahydrofolate cyclohydrolase
MKILDGRELAEFIKERQAKQVRALRQAHGTAPKLAIVVTIEHPAIDVYMRMKNRYGGDILIDVDIHRVKQSKALQTIAELNADDSVHGIIVQLPLEDPAQTDAIVDAVDPAKDVDALGARAVYDPATPMAILWLLAGYNVELRGKHVVLVGRGKLVGAPLERMLLASGIDVEVADSKTADLAATCLSADIIVTATGRPGLVTSDMIKQGAVVVDAGVAGEQGKTVGDLDAAVYDRDDLTITPTKGGVGPLTICALFDNVIRAARDAAEKRAV